MASSSSSSLVHNSPASLLLLLLPTYKSSSAPRFLFLLCCAFLIAFLALQSSTLFASLQRFAPPSPILPHHSSLIPRPSVPLGLTSLPPHNKDISRPARASNSRIQPPSAAQQPRPDSSCNGKRIFMYDLPPEFNDDIVTECENKIAFWINFCNHVQNNGFGKATTPAKKNDSNSTLPDDNGGQPEAFEEEEEGNWQDWYETDPYMLEVIFRRRMESYGCRTENASDADAFFIPYYSGLDGLRYLYGGSRPSRGDHGRTLLRWLTENYGSFWHRKGGADHFIVMGRTAWDFTVPLELTVSDGWGTSLAVLPEMANVTALFLERRPRAQQTGLKEQSIPYPTAFHPRSVETLRSWQSRLLAVQRRRYLFAFVGAPRPSSSPGDLASIRQAALDQCVNSSYCNFLDCLKIDCFHNPLTIGRRLLQSDFCLQPPGDSPTRRSTFDGILSGCIPVFFQADSAYTQYAWHLPPPSGGGGATAEDYSVMIKPHDRWRIAEFLAEIPQSRVAEMRRFIVEEVLPSVIYAAVGGAGWRDAFDLSVDSFLRRVAGENI